VSEENNGGSKMQVVCKVCHRTRIYRGRWEMQPIKAGEVISGVICPKCYAEEKRKTKDMIAYEELPHTD